MNVEREEGLFPEKNQCLRKQMNGSSGLNKKKIQRNSISRSIIFSFGSCVIDSTP